MEQFMYNSLKKVPKDKNQAFVELWNMSTGPFSKCEFSVI